MSNIIRNRLKELEQLNNINILFACESGSRSFGTHSEMSDYDIRFIFVHPLKNYVQIKQNIEVIANHYQKTYDFHGWDLIKTMRLYFKSNPSLYEWIYSPIVYLNKENFQSKLQSLIVEHYSFQTIGKHYEHLIKNNLKRLIKVETLCHQDIKSLLQTLRGWLSINWMIQFHTFPPVSYDILIEGSNFPEELRTSFKELVLMKQENIQNKPLFEFIIEFLTSKFDSLQCQIEALPHLETDVEKGNELIWNVLGINK